MSSTDAAKSKAAYVDVTEDTTHDDDLSDKDGSSRSEQMITDAPQDNKADQTKKKHSKAKLLHFGHHGQEKGEEPKGEKPTRENRRWPGEYSWKRARQPDEPEPTIAPAGILSVHGGPIRVGLGSGERQDGVM